MGVSTSTNRKTYSGDGTTTTFSFPYYFFSQSDLNVYLWDTVAGTVSSQVLNTDYTISGTADSSGNYPNGANVVFGSAPSTTQIIVIVRNPSQVQNTSITFGGNLSSVAIVKQFDYLTLLIQRMQDQINRALILPDGVGGTWSGALPANAPLLANANAYFQQNATANGISLSTQSPSVQVFTVPYTALQSAGTTFNYALFELPAAALLKDVFIKHSSAFTGTGITDVTVSAGISSDYSRFISGFDIFSSPADTNFAQVMASYLGSWANTTQIYLQANSVGANLSALSTGSLNVYATYYYLVG